MIHFPEYNYTDEQIENRVQDLLNNSKIEATRDIWVNILSFIDLTTLNGDDNDKTIEGLCQRARDFEFSKANSKGVAAVCVYPTMVRKAYSMLKGSGLNVASVAGAFPSGQSPLFVKLAEVRYAVQEGAEEIDMVISRGKFLEGCYEEVGGEIKAIKEACGKAHLKVILETGELKTAANIRKASEIAIENGADFIKTSTGKINPAATLEAALVMMDTIKDYYEISGKKVGFKPAGGISEPEDALKYYALLLEVLGKEWDTPDLFRIGASRLAAKAAALI